MMGNVPVCAIGEVEAKSSEIDNDESKEGDDCNSSSPKGDSE